MPLLGRVTRGAGAALVLIALLIGVPAFLVAAVGWPLPRAIPAWDQITGTFAGDLPLDPSTVWKVLACVVWIAWAQVLAATVVERAAAARGGVAIPIRGLAHMQGLTGPLLSAAALLLPSSFNAPGAPAAPPISSARTLVAHSEAPAAPPPAAAPGGNESATAAPTDTATVEHIVARRDTLWDLAERYLAPAGSAEEIGAAVQQLFELNHGRAQPDGSTLTDASLIRPGWVLRIPAAASPPTAAGSTVTVEPGDSLWEIADEHLGDGHRFPEVFDLNAGRSQPDGETLTEPSLIEPGWRLALPTAAAAPATPSVPPPAAAPPALHTPAPPAAEPSSAAPRDPARSEQQPSAPSTTTRPASADEGTPSAEPADDDASVPRGPLGIAGALLGAGIGTALAYRRRRQRVHRRPGTELPPLPAEAAPIVDALAEVDLDLTIGVDHALRLLGRALEIRTSVPVPVVATLDGASLELLLDRDDPEPPEFWTAVAGGRIWRTQLRPCGDDPDAGPAWLPALASIGALDAGGLLLNLEGVGAVGLVGDIATAAALARSLAVELAMTPLADVPSVHVVGSVIGDMTAVPGVRHHTDLAAAVAAAEEGTAPISGAMAGTGVPTAIQLRCRAPEEAWPPAIVVASTTEADADDLHRLIERCQERAGVVAVLVGDCPPGALEVHVSAEAVAIPALGLRCVPQQLDESTVDLVAELLDAAEEPCIAPTDEGPLTLFTAAEMGSDAEADGLGPKLHLRLLGPITVEGAELRPQQLALLAYLALHPDATADAVRDAVWGGKAPTRERFLNTIHELRRAVGPDVLPASTDGRYRLRRVWCDLAEVERRVASASVNPDEATGELRVALELVNGPPLTFESRHRRHFRWVDLGNHASRWERVVGDAAHDLASVALGNEDVDLARWAAERGLLASPVNETLTGDLVSAHLAAGDRMGAERVVDEYSRVLEDLGYDEPPEALHELLESRRAS